MRVVGSTGSGFLALMAALPALAQDGGRPSLPDTVACPEAVAAIATCYGGRHESGAYLLAAMPKQWNGNLIVFAHGGPSVVAPKTDDSVDDLAKYAIGVQRGFAWVASTYRREGYGVQMAAEDTDHARQFFIARIAKPRRTILHGASYGGLVGAKLLEKYAKSADGTANYDGAFFNSGAVGGSMLNYEFRADLRAVYQYYCKNLPRPEEAQYPIWQGLPSGSKMTLKEVQTRVDECTGVGRPAAARSETQKQNLANIVAVMRVPETMVARHMQAATFVFREVADRITQGQNAFSNRGITYRGSKDDVALNRDVPRFDANPAATAALKGDGEPIGLIPVPVVSIHSFNDPQAAVEAQHAYREKAKAAGRDGLLVQAYTDERAHTAQSAPEIAGALEALMQWIEMKEKPTAADIAEMCAQLATGFEGPCRYHPEYEPKPFSTRFARGASAS